MEEPPDVRRVMATAHAYLKKPRLLELTAVRVDCAHVDARVARQLLAGRLERARPSLVGDLGERVVDRARRRQALAAEART